MRRILLVLSVAALMAAMLAATAGTALAQVERGECLEGIPCRQGVLLPDEPKGNVYNGFGQASSSCASFDVRDELDREIPDAAFKQRGQAPENQTIAFVHCFEGPEPIE
jgi:hypothetical protein